MLIRFGILLLLLLALVACGTTIVIATPTPVPDQTATTDPPTIEPTNIPTLPAASTILPTSTAMPVAAPTVEPTPTMPPMPTFQPELTQGVKALVHCAGNTEEHWLEHGPPSMTAELVECLNDMLEAN